MYQLHIRVLAREDIQQIVDYYDRIRSHIADTFLENLYAEFDVIVENPNLFQRKYRNTRVRYLKKFPYGIHYIIREETIEILAVIHTRRNPKVWESR